MKSLAVMMAMSLMLVSCGGSELSGSGGGHGAPTPGETINSVFIDAPVKGLKVRTFAGEITTGEGGVFQCLRGEILSFGISDMTLGKASCEDQIYLYELGISNSDNYAALIQSLSVFSGGALDLSLFNANPITLSDINPSSSSDIDADIKKFFMDHKLGDRGLNPVLLADAQAHVEKYLPKLEDDVLDGLASNGHQSILLEASASNKGKSCWENVELTVGISNSVLGLGNNSKQSYFFQVDGFKGWNGPNAPSCLVSNREEVCRTNLGIWKYMTSRFSSISKLRPKTSTVKKGDVVACLDGKGNYEVIIDGKVPSLAGCPKDTKEVKAATDQSFTITPGETYSVSVTDSTATISYKAFIVDVDLEPSRDNDLEVTFLEPKSYYCDYSFSHEFSPGDSGSDGSGSGSGFL